MGSIVGAAIVGHVPTVMVPEATRRSLGGGQDTTLVAGFGLLRDRLDAAGVDTLVIIDTHWFTTAEHIVAGHEHHKGTYTSEELPKVIRDLRFDYRGAPELGRSIARIARRQDLWVLNTTDERVAHHYPTLNIVHHVARGERVLSTGVCQTADADDFLAFGAVIAEAIEESDTRVAILGSGGLSHRFWPLRASSRPRWLRPRARDHAEARAFDERIIGLARGRRPRRSDRPVPRLSRPCSGRTLRPLPHPGRGARRTRLLPRGRTAIGLRELLRHRPGPSLVRLVLDRGEAMTLVGWTLPQSATGRASSLPPPPWHYSGEVIAVDFTADPARVAELVPPGFEATADGSCSFVFCDWSSAAELDPRDPGRSLPRPVQGGIRRRPRQVRGNAGRQGAVHLGRFRSVAGAGVDPGLPEEARGAAHDPPGRAGQGRCSQGTRRAIRGARLRVGTPARHPQRHHRRASPRDLPERRRRPTRAHAPVALASTSPLRRSTSSADGTITDFQVGTVWHGSAELSFGASEFEEIDRLEPRTVGDGWVLAMAFSVVGGTTHPAGGGRDERARRPTRRDSADPVGRGARTGSPSMPTSWSSATDAGSPRTRPPICHPAIPPRSSAST